VREDGVGVDQGQMGAISADAIDKGKHLLGEARISTLDKS
jgi:hypothetical protein